ncbi:hypothetical protein [Sulfobacillus thermosulfidooxidans]|uniref:hypothetical protein n=1 Tax=Sulfobacillus thermosulfidooxidans TaxID=28034 RepID=UPI0006B68857|nr:hypothetical protein [Sulfobacillus thermosulfidooxidans]
MNDQMISESRISENTPQGHRPSGNQLAAARTQQRRQIKKELRASIRVTLVNLRLGLKAARDEVRWLADALPRPQELLRALEHDAMTEDEPAAPRVHHGKAPTPLRIYQFLVQHTAWESMSGRARQRALRAHKESLENAVRQEALDQILDALDRAINAARGKPKLIAELRMMAQDAIWKLKGRGRWEAPILISQLYDQRTTTMPKNEYVAQTTPHSSTLTAPDAAIATLMDHPVPTRKTQGIFRQTTTPAPNWDWAHRSR